MGILPPHALVVRIDGRQMHANHAPAIRNSRAFVPISPVVTAIAERIESDGNAVFIYRGDRFVRVSLRRPLLPREFSQTLVPARVLTDLGVIVRYESRTHVLDIRTPARRVALPTPFNPAVPRAVPSAVFTPQVSPTPKPTVTGLPIPRRTPNPLESPGASGER